MAYISIYKDNPTAGSTNGTKVSEGTGTAPVEVGPLLANESQEQAVKLAIRCDAGYTTVGTTKITPVGTTAGKWALSLDGNTYGAYGAALDVTAAIGATNVVFYAKAQATPDENPANDTSVDLKIDATIGAA